MSLSLGVVMDPLKDITYHKDSSFAMMLEAQRRGYEIWVMDTLDLSLDANRPRAKQQRVKLFDRDHNWYHTEEEKVFDLTKHDVILMRKNPPFNIHYISATYILEHAHNAGVLVLNPPQALRDFNEKLAITLFPQCCVESIVSAHVDEIKLFIKNIPQAIVKPVDSMGGTSIFRLTANDPNLNVILETVTKEEQEYVMVQRYISEISEGDKRILMIDGDAIPYSLARIPAEGEFRGNLVLGAKGKGQELSNRDLWIANEIGPWLKQQGILFAGLDVIGDYLTEINITSPTCIRELDSLFDLNISAALFDKIEDLVQGSL